MSFSGPSDEDRDELLLSCRYGDLEDIQRFVDNFGAEALTEVRDESGNTVLHMVSANGHIDALEYLLSVLPAPLLSTPNHAGSTPLHWAALNSQLAVVQTLVRYEKGPGKDLIDIKNAAGRTPLGEAENIGWDEGAKWMVEVMNLDEKGREEEDATVDASQDIEVEIQDAEGQVARMKIGTQGSTEPSPSV
ncbi:cytoplasmic protein [Panus rudis PR-1116 ss-1]|nr:cytoplasmic protein [Panus rudis PR-1116 ss-1]